MAVNIFPCIPCSHHSHHKPFTKQYYTPSEHLEKTSFPLSSSYTNSKSIQIFSMELVFNPKPTSPSCNTTPVPKYRTNLLFRTLKNHYTKQTDARIITRSSPFFIPPLLWNKPLSQNLCASNLSFVLWLTHQHCSSVLQFPFFPFVLISHY